MLTIADANSSVLHANMPISKHFQTEQERPMKIMVVDDHFLIREALHDLLKQFKDNMIVMEATSGHQAMQLVSEHADISLILLDLSLPDRDGFSVLSELRNCYPTVRVVVLSDHPDRNTVVKALDLGALGLIPKSGQRQIIPSALQLVFAGGIYIPHGFLTSEDSPTSPADLGLTGRQLDVLALMAQGKSNKAICRDLKLAVPTVKNHVTAILKSLKVTNRTEAVIAVGDLGRHLGV